MLGPLTVALSLQSKARKLSTMMMESSRAGKRDVEGNGVVL